MARDFGTTRGQLYTQAQATSYGLGSRGAGGGSARASRAGGRSGRRGRRRRGRRGQRRESSGRLPLRVQGSWRLQGGSGCRLLAPGSDWLPGRSSIGRDELVVRLGVALRVLRAVGILIPWSGGPPRPPDKLLAGAHGLAVHRRPHPAAEYLLLPPARLRARHRRWRQPTVRPYGGQVGSCRLVDGIGFTVAEVCGIPDGRDGERRRRVCFTRSHRS